VLLASWLLSDLALPTNATAETVQRARLRVDTIRTGLTVGAGTAGALALLLAARRQWLAERAQEAGEFDAAERHFTELYLKAAEQLGSEKAPVRLAGLYALERLAQGNPGQRQAIVHLICGYLRMPYDPPQRPRPQSGAASSDVHEELQVRLTAQRILSNHLAVPAGVDVGKLAKLRASPIARFWPGMSLDLIGANLVDFDLGRRCVSAAAFTGATFHGDAVFGGSTFADYAWFEGATFVRAADFSNATFEGTAGFVSPLFLGRRALRERPFSGNARFERATFADAAWFGDASFQGHVGFHESRVVNVATGRTYLWPSGWRLDPDQADPTAGRLVPV
jgi:hypothetical protein